MAIITISRGSYYQSKEVAEKLAETLGYDCVSRDDIIESLGEFHLPEIKLVRGLHDAFRILDRFQNGKERFTAAIRARILNRFKGGNVVYHGLAGHFLTAGIPQVLRVRIIADLEDRVRKEVGRSGISPAKARFLLQSDDEERRRWCLFLYGADIWDPGNYDMVLSIGRIRLADAVDLLAQTARLPFFETSDASHRMLADKALAASVKDALIEFPTARVSARDGNVRVTVKSPLEEETVITGQIRASASALKEIQHLEIVIDPYY